LKSERVQRANADPMIFQIYMNISIFITSWLVLSYNEMSLTVWGILSSVLWMISSLLSIFAIKNAGLAVSQGIWSGFTSNYLFNLLYPFYGDLLFFYSL